MEQVDKNKNKKKIHKIEKMKKRNLDKSKDESTYD